MEMIGSNLYASRDELSNLGISISSMDAWKKAQSVDIRSAAADARKKVYRLSDIVAKRQSRRIIAAVLAARYGLDADSIDVLELLAEKHREDQQRLTERERQQQVSMLAALVVVDSDELAAIQDYLQNRGKYKPYQYARACAYARSYSSLPKRKQELKTVCGYSSRTDVLTELHRLAVLEDQAFFPANIRVFQRWTKQYVEADPAWMGLVPKYIGNGNAAKIRYDAQKAFIRQLLARGMHSYQRVTDEYNAHVERHNAGTPAAPWETVDVRTIGAWIERDQRTKKIITASREGSNSWEKQYETSITQERPTQPLYRINHDGSPWELYYQQVAQLSGGRTETRYWYRKVVVMVIDVYNDYPLGYAIGDQENKALIKAALKNAADHIRELTGDYFLPWEMKFDRFGYGKDNDLAQFYCSMAKTIPNRARKPRKRIESFFHNAIKECLSNRHQHFPNFAGYNITAQQQVNREKLEAQRHSFPDEQGVIEQIHENVHYLRNNPRKLPSHIAQKAASLNLDADQQYSRQQVWLAGWQAMKPEDQRPISRHRYLKIFGKAHSLRGHAIKNRLTNEGLTPTLMGVERQFNMRDIELFNTTGMQYQVIYDPADLSDILAIGEDGREWVIPEMVRGPGSLRDAKPEQMAEVKAWQQWRDARKNEIATEHEADWRLIEGDMSQVELEGAMKSFFSIKGTNKHIQQRASDALKPPKQNNDNNDIYGHEEEGGLIE